MEHGRDVWLSGSHIRGSCCFKNSCLKSGCPSGCEKTLFSLIVVLILKKISINAEKPNRVPILVAVRIDMLKS